MNYNAVTSEICGALRPLVTPLSAVNVNTRLPYHSCLPAHLRYNGTRNAKTDELIVRPHIPIDNALWITRINVVFGNEQM
ncbi:hypothetical protein J6590_057079 [Homalodisca vitripennis]|nr:hypothetical protein J6590_057079 [Homalodisca vitripennis]